MLNLYKKKFKQSFMSHQNEENDYVINRKPSYLKTYSSMSNSTNASSNHLHLTEHHDHLNTPSNMHHYHNHQSHFPNHSKTLKLFKDIKNLQCIIQNNE